MIEKLNFINGNLRKKWKGDKQSKSSKKEHQDRKKWLWYLLPHQKMLTKA